MFEQAEPVFRDKTISSQNKTIDSTIVPRKGKNGKP